VANDPACPCCGVAYREHLGLTGTCAEVVRLRYRLRVAVRVAADALGEDEWRRMYRAALEGGSDGA
jgi:hypothetical protein